MATYNTQTRTVHLDTRQVREVANQIYETDKTIAPFLYFARMNKKETSNPKYESYYRGTATRYDTCHGANADTSSTAIVVHDAAMFRTYDVIHVVRTGENMYVTDVTTGTNTLTVVRGIGTTAAAILDNDVVYAAGTAAPEGDTRVETVSSQPTSAYNYTQIFKTTMELSNTAMATNIYGPNELADDRDRKMRQHMIEIETAFLFGGRNIITSGDSVTRFTGGVIPTLGTGANVHNQSGTLTRKQLNDFLAPIMTYGNSQNKRICLTNQFGMGILNTFTETFLHHEISSRTNDKFGFNFRVYESYVGTLNCIEHKLLTRMYTTAGVYLFIDPDYIQYRYLTGRDTKFQDASLDSTLLDGYVGQYITECGLELTGTECHGWLYGVSAAA